MISPNQEDTTAWLRLCLADRADPPSAAWGQYDWANANARIDQRSGRPAWRLLVSPLGCFAARVPRPRSARSPVRALAPSRPHPSPTQGPCVRTPLCL